MDITTLSLPVLAAAGHFEVMGAILALLPTHIFLVGLLERRDKTLLRTGYDSVFGLLVFAGGVAALAGVGG